LALADNECKNKIKMKRQLLLICIVLNFLFSCYAQKQNEVMPEKYDFELMKKFTDNGALDTVIRRGNTLIYVSNMRKSGAFYKIYLPKPEFHVKYKNFYSDGTIKSEGKYIGENIAIEESIFYDEEGNITKVDEDKKFGAIKREDIIKLLEKEGWFNRKTGENMITEDSILPTNYKPYRNIGRYMDITFKKRVTDKQGNEIEPPKWFIEINPRNRGRITNYIIDGNTGEFEKKEKFMPGIE